MTKESKALEGFKEPMEILEDLNGIMNDIGSNDIRKSAAAREKFERDHVGEYANIDYTDPRAVMNYFANYKQDAHNNAKRVFNNQRRAILGDSALEKKLADNVLSFEPSERVKETNAELVKAHEKAAKWRERIARYHKNGEFDKETSDEITEAVRKDVIKRLDKMYKKAYEAMSSADREQAIKESRELYESLIINNINHNEKARERALNILYAKAVDKFNSFFPENGEDKAKASYARMNLEDKYDTGDESDKANVLGNLYRLAA